MATVIGEEMVKVDTSAADTTFFVRQAAAYAELKDYQGRGRDDDRRDSTSSRRPSPSGRSDAKVQSRAGNPQGALDCATKLVQLDSTNGANYLLIARAQAGPAAPGSRGRGDPERAAGRRAARAPTARGAARRPGQLLLVIGNQAYKAASAANPQNKNDYKRAVALLAFADSVAPSAEREVRSRASRPSRSAMPTSARTSRRRSATSPRRRRTTCSWRRSTSPPAVRSIRRRRSSCSPCIQQYGPSVDGQLKKYCK